MTKFTPAEGGGQGTMSPCIGYDGEPDGAVNARGYTDIEDPALQAADADERHAYWMWVRHANRQRAATGRPPGPYDARWREAWRGTAPGVVPAPCEAPPVTEPVLEQPEATPAPPDPPDPSTNVEVEPCAVCVATCPDGWRATKRYHATGDGEVVVDGYDVGDWITSQMIDVPGLERLAELLDWLEGQPTRWIMRGELRDETQGQRPHRRRAHDRHPDPSYQPADRRWLMADVDALEWPRGIEPGDGAAIAEWVVEQLPECFHGAGYVWQFSPSAGVGGWGVVKLHLWFWLDRAVCDESWREYITEGVPVLDTAPFNPVQPHYCARPVFEGVDDPLEGRQRTGFVPGPPVCAPRQLVDGRTWRTRQAEVMERQRAARQRMQAARAARGQTRGYARGALRRACEAIRSAPEGARHETIRRESLATSRFVSAGELDAETWRDELKRAGVEVLPRNRWSEIDRLIDGALEIEGVA